MVGTAANLVLFACAVCGYATPEQEGALLRSTLFLTIGPLLMIGGVAWYVFGHYKNGKDGEFKKPDSKRSPTP